MAVFYGVSGHSPDEVIKALLKFDPSPTYKVVELGKHFDPSGRYKNIICLTKEDFIRNFKVLSSLNKNVFVFASHLFLSEYKGFNRLDYSIDLDNPAKILVHDELDDSLLRNPTVFDGIRRKKTTYLEQVIKKAKSGSVFDKLMTYIYKLPAKTHQKPVKKLCCLYLRNDWSKDTLIKELRSLGTQIKLSQPLVDSISSILFSAVAYKYQEAFTKINSVSDVADVALQYDLNPYEFMYILKMLEADRLVLEKSKVSIDTYLANEKKQ